MIVCSMGSFAILSSSLSSIQPTNLGVTAASPSVLASSYGPAGPGQGLNAVAASMGINLGERRQRRREDDEYSISLASASTASTLRSKKSNGTGAFQPAEGDMKLAMGMVSSISSRPNEP